MQKRFASNLILLLFLNLLVKPFYVLGIDAEVQNRVAENVYGNYFALINLSFLLNIVLDMGINNFNTTQISKNASKLKRYFSSIFTLRLALFVIYMIFLGIVAITIGYQSEQFHLLLILGINQGLASMVLFFRSNLSGLHLFKQDSIISVLDRLILIGLMSVLLWGNVTGTETFDIMWFVYGQTLAYSITGFIAFILVLRKSNGFRFYFPLAKWKTIIQGSLPYALLVLLMTINYRVDSVMLERMLPDGARQAGIYAKGYRIFEAVNMIGFLFAGLLLPIFSKQIKQKESVFPLLKLAFRMLFSGTLIIAIASMLYDTQLVGLRFTSEVQEAAPIFGILMFSFMAVSMSYIFGTLLTANENLKALNIVALASMALNVLLNYLLIPSLFAYGSAVASLISQGLMSILQIVIVLRIFKPQFDKRLAYSFGAFIVGIGILTMLLTIIDLQWQLEIITFLGAGILIALATRMLSIRRFIEIMKNR